MDYSRIRDLVAELDLTVPREGAVARLEQYGGGPDESQVIANRSGGIRLGIEFLKAALAADEKATEARPGVQIELDYLLDPDSDVDFDWLEVREELQPAAVIRSRSARLVEVALGLLVLLAIFGIGIATVIGWLS